eukprot:gene27787-34557_t
MMPTMAENTPAHTSASGNGTPALTMTAWVLPAAPSPEPAPKPAPARAPQAKQLNGRQEALPVTRPAKPAARAVEKKTVLEDAVVAEDVTNAPPPGSESRRYSRSAPAATGQASQMPMAAPSGSVVGNVIANASNVRPSADYGRPPTSLEKSATAGIDYRASAVSIDEHGAAYEMTRHLIELGHERIGFVMGNPAQSCSALRLAGYQAALRDFGGQLAPELVVPGLFNYRSGLDAAEQLLALRDRPTAIFASNDDMAAAAVAVAHRLRLDVPGDLTVTGFDDTALAMTIWPALTTVRQPTAAMAEAAVQCLVRQVQAQRSQQPSPTEQLSIGFTLIRRQSDAPPRIRPPARAY